MNKKTLNRISGVMAFAVAWANGGLAFAADVTGHGASLQRLEAEIATVKFVETIDRAIALGTFDLPAAEAEQKFMKGLAAGVETMKASVRAKIATKSEAEAQADLSQMISLAQNNGNEAVNEQMSELAADSTLSAREKLSSIAVNLQTGQMVETVTRTIHEAGSVVKMLKMTRAKLLNKDYDDGNWFTNYPIIWVPIAVGIVLGVGLTYLTGSIWLGVGVGVGGPLVFFAGLLFLLAAALNH